MVRDWIRRLPIRKDERLLVERLRDLDKPAVLAREKADWERNVRRTAQWLARGKGRDTANDDDRRAAEAELKKRAAAGVRERAAERASTIDRLLASTSSAFLLADALGEDRMPASVRAQVLAASLKLADAQVRDLFERFVPDDQRVKRLGSVIKPEQILSLKGNAERGRDLFFKSAGLQCVNCHKINGTGSTLGPDLSQIGKKATRGQILESLLEPSKQIEPAYVAYLLETTRRQGVHRPAGVEERQGGGAEGGRRQGGARAGGEGGAAGAAAEIDHARAAAARPDRGTGGGPDRIPVGTEMSEAVGLEYRL